MSKYKIMIVDDEAEVREGIAKKINWDALGFEIIATAENGQDALEKVELYDIDVILSDIKMPFMDGLTLGHQLQRQHPAIKLILLTGFDEFEYAKEAIKLGVVEYILKPVNEQELNEILTRVKTSIDDEIARMRNIEALRESYKKSLPLQKERFLNDLLWGLIPDAEARSISESFALPFSREGKKNVTIFEIDQKTSAQSQITRELMPVSVKQIVDAVLSGKCEFESFISSNTVVAVMQLAEGSTAADVIANANEACVECRRLLELAVTAGISSCCEETWQLRRCFDEAGEAIEYKAIVGVGTTIYIRDMELFELADVQFDGAREKNLISSVKFGTRTQIESAVDEIISQLQNQSEEEWPFQSYLIGVFNCIANIIRRFNIDNSAVLGEESKTYFRLSTGYSLAELRDWLVRTCTKMNRYLSERRLSTEESIIGEAKDYITQNFTNSELSVEALCERLHLSQSYFSTLFKHTTGQSYVNFVTELRMQKALELLRDTEEKTYIIARSVGYEEPNYFSYVFKKRFGKSPSQYRAGIKE
ncbi:MAG: response regulator [Oscillospiraceae bacterium]